MSDQLHASRDEMGFLWSSIHLTNSEACDALVHHGPNHCFLEFFRKLLDVGKVGAKYYVFFHAIPLLLKLKKAKSLVEVALVIKNVGFSYFKSLLFMAFLVGLLRGGLCFNEHILQLPHFYSFFITAPLSSASILFESSSRRNQIAYYVCAKALRSVYMGLKRSLRLTKLDEEGSAMHVLLMASLYYIYNHHPKMVKYRNLFEFILGDS